ncbi:MAG: hypothetical protein Kapaf2KO_17900 [Candidatus Kapaibacteriales bacterium]
MFFGGSIGYGANIHLTDFSALDGVASCCLGYETEFGYGFMAGLNSGYYLGSSIFVQGRIAYDQLNGNFDSFESESIAIDGLEAEGEFGHFMDINSGGMAIDLSVGIDVAGGFALTTGPALFLPFSGDYDYREEITQPPNRGVFVDENQNPVGRVRAESAGDIPNASALLIGWGLDLAYRLPLSNDNKLWLKPEVLVDYYTNGLAEDKTWSILSTKAAVGIEYFILPEGQEVIRDTIIKRDTTDIYMAGIDQSRIELIDIKTDEQQKTLKGQQYIEVVTTERYRREIPKQVEIADKVEPIKTKSLGLDLDVVAINENGEELEGVVLKTNKFIATTIKPLLPYIFFGKNETVVKSEYLKERLAEDTYAPKIYYSLIDTIAQRAKNGNTTIMIKGMAAPDETEEIARMRAENVRQVFESRTGINPSITYEKYDGKISNNDDRELILEELRRVEISTKKNVEEDIVVMRDTIVISNPPAVRIKPSKDIKSKDEIGEWSLEALTSGQQVYQTRGETTLPETLDWQVGSTGAFELKEEGEIVFNLTAYNELGQKETASDAISYERNNNIYNSRDTIGEFEVGRYELILFEYDSDQVLEKHKKAIEEIKKLLRKDSKVVIEGYADKIGSDEVNIDLAGRRAKNVAKLLSDYQVETKAIGEKIELYNNAKPQGRMYSRAVRITTFTPIK